MRTLERLTNSTPHRLDSGAAGAPGSGASERGNDEMSRTRLMSSVVRLRRRAVAVSAAAVVVAGGVVAATGSASGASSAPRAASVVVHGVPIAEDAMLAGTVPAAVKSAGMKDITYNDFAPDEYIK